MYCYIVAVAFVAVTSKVVAVVVAVVDATKAVNIGMLPSGFPMVVRLQLVGETTTAVAAVAIAAIERAKVVDDRTTCEGRLKFHPTKDHC